MVRDPGWRLPSHAKWPNPGDVGCSARDCGRASGVVILVSAAEVTDTAWSPLQRVLIESMPGERIVPRAFATPGSTLPRRYAGAHVERLSADPRTSGDPPFDSTSVLAISFADRRGVGSTPGRRADHSLVIAELRDGMSTGPARAAFGYASGARGERGGGAAPCTLNLSLSPSIFNDLSSGRPSPGVCSGAARRHTRAPCVDRSSLDRGVVQSHRACQRLLNDEHARVVRAGLHVDNLDRTGLWRRANRCDEQAPLGLPAADEPRQHPAARVDPRVQLARDLAEAPLRQQFRRLLFQPVQPGPMLKVKLTSASNWF